MTIKSLYKSDFIYELYKNLKSYPAWNIILPSICVLIIVMNITTSETFFPYHPDETATTHALDYYLNHAVPPDVRDENLFFCQYGKTRLSEFTFYYQFAAWSTYFLNSPTAIIRYRTFNVLLFCLLTTFALCSKNKNMLCLCLTISPQLWYIFSYATSDALDFFLSFIMVWQLIEKNGIIYKYLTSEKFNLTTAGRLSISALLLGLILMGKKTYYVILIFCFFILLIIFIDLPKNKRKTFFWRCVLLCTAGVFLAALRFIQMEAIHDFNRAEILKNVTESRWDEKFMLEGGTAMLKQKGFSLYDMLFNFYNRNWFDYSSKSFFGYYGYLKYDNPLSIYVIQYILFGFLLFIPIAFIKKINLPDSYSIFYVLSFIFCSIISIALSIYNSWVVDCQPQGRYLFPIIVMSTVLFKNLDFTTSKKLKYTICFVGFLLAIMNIYSFLFVGIYSFSTI